VKPASPSVCSRLLLCVVCVWLAGLSSDLCAQTGWLPTSWFSQTAIDPQAMFPLAENDGPWLVLATTFRGEGARDDARALVHELRRVNKLKAYTHEKSFDYTGKQQEATRARSQARRHPKKNAIRERRTSGGGGCARR